VYGTRGMDWRVGVFWKCGTHQEWFWFHTLDAGVPFFESYGIVTEQARLVKTVKVILGLAL
jgi:rhamnogalacturonyl hydrolase YesR